MIRVLSVSYLLGALLVCADALAQARTVTPFPVYRHAEMERRFQAEGKLPGEPSRSEERAALLRAGMAVRARDAAGLTAAARDLVVHASETTAGWNKAAAAWIGLSRSWRAYGDGRDNRRDRRNARLMARRALREAAYSLYAADRSTSHPLHAGRSLIAFGTVQETVEEHVSAELALSAALSAMEDFGARDRLERVREKHGFRIAGIRQDRDRGDPVSAWV